MKNSPELLVYKASAGSGKTFTLAVEYIKLLILNPRAYRNILAVTFTNKATTEMKERILSQLYGIWINDKSSKAYLEKITEELGMPKEQIRMAAGKALHLMIHDYSRFRVETIDSFFQSVMRNLARELELGANLTIELNNMEVLSDAVDSMIERLNRQSPVLYWLLDYIEERIADDKRWNVSGEIKNFGRNIFDEGYIEKGDGLRRKLQDKDCIKNYRRTLQAIETEALEQMKGFADQFFGILESNGLAIDNLANKSKGVSSYFSKLQMGKLDDSLRNATVEKHLASPENWSSKSSPRRNAITELAAAELIPLLQTAEEFRSKNNMLVNSCQLSLRYINNVRLLANIDEEVRRLNYENNRFLLSDTNVLLHNLVHDGDSSFVFEKIGTTIRNVMIDEFQDTSRMQWDNFRLLLLEGLSQGENSLIVGDVKQSIYRWRNGDWGILNGLKDHIESFPINVKTLTTNRRSAGNIIEFNNKVFTAACHTLNDIYKSEQGEECKDLKEAYVDVCQEKDKDPDGGYVKVTFLTEKEEMAYVEDTLQQLANETQLLVTAGIHQHVGVRRVAGEAEQIAHGRPAAVFAAGLDLDIHGPDREDLRMDERHDGARVMHRGPSVADGPVELVEELQPLRHDIAHRVAERAHARKVLRQDQRLFRHVQPRHRDGDAGGEDDLRRLRVDQNVEFRGRGPVAGGDAAAHEADAGDLALQLRMRQQQRRDVRLRAGGDDGDGLFGLAQDLRHQLRRGKLGRGEGRFRQRRAVEARFAVDRGRVHHVVQQRMRAALADRCVQPDERADAQGVVGGFFDRLIAAARGHGENVELPARPGQDPRDGVVMAGVAVEDDGDLFQFGHTKLLT